MSRIPILVVDDEQAFTEILAQRLGKRGFTVKTAADGNTGLRVLTNDESRRRSNTGEIARQESLTYA